MNSYSPQISADPPDINILQEYGNDPRVVTNLIDGVYRTRYDETLLHNIVPTLLSCVGESSALLNITVLLRC